MVKPFYNEETISVGDDTYRLVINFRAIDAIESLMGQDFDGILLKFIGRGRVPRAMQAKFLWGLLREHHAELTLDQAMSLTFGASAEKVGEAIGKLIGAAFSFTDKGEEKVPNPPEPPGA